MADQDAEHAKSMTLGAWRWKLRQTSSAIRVAVQREMDAAARRLSDAGFHPMDIDRAVSQMRNGAATPTDFTHNTVA